MRKKLCAVLLLIVMLLSFTTGCNNAAVNDNKSMQANNLSQLELSKDNMTKTIQEITTHPRAVNSEQIKVVEEYLIKQFESYGYTEIDKQQFFYNNDNNENAIRRSSQSDIYLAPTADSTNADGVGNNIIVTKRVDDTTKELILSAHFDSTENSYGVNDNASGVAVVLELARVLSDIELPYNLKFIMFSGEEKYMLGSRWYVNTLSEEERKNIIGVINIDTIAEKSDLGYMLMLHGDKKIENNQYTDEDLKRLADANKNSVSELFGDKDRFVLTMATNSDHYPFSLIGIPAVSIVQDWNEGINANSPDDVFSKIDADRLYEIASEVLSIVKTFQKKGDAIIQEVHFYERTPAQTMIEKQEDGWYKVPQRISAFFEYDGETPSSVVAYFTQTGTEMELYKKEIGKITAPYTYQTMAQVLSIDLNFSDEDTLGHFWFVFNFEDGSSVVSEIYNMYIE